jgi:hypothetical protein
MKRKIFAATLICLLLLATGMPVFASSDSTATTTIEHLSNGDYIETTIEETTPGFSFAPLAAYSTKSGSKTISQKNSAGAVQWYVKVTGSFTYNGSTSSCTSASVDSASNVTVWKVSNKSASKSGATAIGKTTAKLYSASLVIQTINETVKLTCSKTGVLS